MPATTYQLISQSVILTGEEAIFVLSPIGAPASSTQVILVIESPEGVASIGPTSPLSFDTLGTPVIFRVTFQVPGNYQVYANQFPTHVLTDPYTVGSPLSVAVSNPKTSIIGTPIPGLLIDDTDPSFELSIGVAANRTVYLLDEQDQPEDLSAVTSATLTIKKMSTDTIPVIQKSTVSGTLTVVSGGVTAVFTSVDTALLSIGTYFADVAFQIGGNWYNTEPFEVHASQPITVPS